jgi:heme O synthase-like polyprenyltransferase
MKIKPYATFLLALISIVGSLVLAFAKNTDITVLLPTLLGIYIGAKAGVTANSHWAASKDSNADTSSVIKDTDTI